ncbi:hypothetical protein BK648_24590 [Pseudomonas poae]|uniref:OB-fold domain-containing protein n=1 Tax=Pseudomonas poae TaxID=200451 RepID=A0A423ERK7_9PSED|nr:OB-fold domain-containing protein [Pseudomonas poae]ROM33941.1 hypothetical protein BK648_24590 [Pseudomonas poae]
MTDELISKAPPDELFELATDAWTEPYWNAAREHRLVMPRCTDCGKAREIGAPFCHHCQSQGIEWVQASGKAKIYSYTVVRFALIEAMKECVPYVPAVIQLDDFQDNKLISNVVGVALSDITIGSSVELIWHDRADGVSLPRFTLSKNKKD